MNGCVRQLNKTQRMWAGVLGLLAVLGAVALVPGCGCGGWTGGWCSAGSESKGDYCRDESIAYEQHSMQGPSAQELVATYGGVRTGASTAVSESFWTATGLESTNSPLPLEIDITYADGEVLENRCESSLSVAVALTVKLGNGLAEWQVPAQLELVSGVAALSAVLPASGTALSTDFDLSVDFSAEPATALLHPVNGLNTEWAAFELE